MSLPRYLPNVDVPRLGGLDDLGLWHDSDGKFQRRGVTSAKAASVRAVPGRAVADAAKARPDGAEARLRPESPLAARLGDGPLRVVFHDEQRAKVTGGGRPVLVAWDQFAEPVTNEMSEAPDLADLKTTAEITRWLAAKYAQPEPGAPPLVFKYGGGRHFDLTGMKPATARRVAAEIDRLFTKYPEAARHVGAVTSNTGSKAIISAAQRATGRGVRKTTRNADAVADIGLMRFKNVMDDFESADGFEGGTTIEAVVAHEFGHIVDRLAQIVGNRDEARAQWNGMNYRYMFTSVTTRQPIARDISPYAATNEQETAAEAFAMVEHGTPTPLARAVYDLMTATAAKDRPPIVNEMAARPTLRPHREVEAEREAIYVEIGKLQAAGEERYGKKWRDTDQAGADTEDALFAKARALKEGWEADAGALISTGVLTPAQIDEYSDDRRGIADRIASNLGGPSQNGWQPLPQRLYHVTTARDAVLNDGALRTRTELALERGTGLGGGTSDAISFAADPKVAADIRDGILEAIDVTSGKTTVADLLDRARTGDHGSEPFIEDLVGYWKSGWKIGDDLPRGLEMTLPGGENDDPEHRFDVLKIWLAYREHRKGPVDPLFFSVDAATLAATDPEQVAILEALPKPGAMGIPLGGLLGEWRTPTGAAVDISLPLPPVENELVDAPAAPTVDYSFVDDTTVPWADRVSLLAHERAALAAELGDPNQWFTHPSTDTLNRLWSGDLTPAETESLERLGRVEQFGDAVARLVAERSIELGGGEHQRAYTVAATDTFAEQIESFISAPETLDPSDRFRKAAGTWHGTEAAKDEWATAIEKIRTGQANIIMKPRAVVFTYLNDDDHLVRVSIEKDDSKADTGGSVPYLNAAGKQRYKMDTRGHIDLSIATGVTFGEPRAWVRGAGNFDEVRAAIKAAHDASKKEIGADLLNPPTLRAWTEVMEGMGFDMSTDPGVLVAEMKPKGKPDLVPVGDVKPSSMLGKTTTAGFAPYPRAWTAALPPQVFQVVENASSRAGSAYNQKRRDGNLLSVPSAAAHPQHASTVAHEVGHTFQEVIPGLHLGETWHMLRRVGQHPGEQYGEVSGGRGKGFADHFADDYSGRFYPGPNPRIPEDKRGGYFIINGEDPYKQPDGEAIPAIRAFEIFTTGVQTLYSVKPGKRRLGDDPELTAFATGMLALSTPTAPDAAPPIVNEIVERPGTADGFEVGATSVKLSKQGTPPAPGRAKIPDGAVRLYHSTSSAEALQSILDTGLHTEFEGTGQGRNPDHPGMVWATTRKLDGYDHFVEFWMNPDEVEGPANATRIAGTVPPDRIVSYNSPTLANLLAYRRMFKDMPTDALVERDPVKTGSDTQKAAWRLLLAERGAAAPAAVRFDGMHPLPDGDTTAHGVKFPPAWTDVHVSDRPEGVGGMIARGVDSKGRQQYLYSTEHTERQAAAKFARVKAFTEHLPKLDADLTGDVATDDTAAALALIRRTGMRPGGTTDTKADKQAYGATTLLGSHVTLQGDTVRFQFVGKKGVNIDIAVTDDLVATAIRARLDKVGTDEPLFATTAAKVNQYLDDHTAPEFKVKDLRTVRANAVAAAMVAARPVPPTSERERKRWVNEVGDAVAAQLGNTRTVALASYINPLVFGPWSVGETAADLDPGEVFSVGGIKIRKTADGYVDDATGLPVAADGTPL